MTKKEITSIIRKKRRMMEISQEELAESTGVSGTTIYKIEKGDSNFAVETLFNICKHLRLVLYVEEHSEG